jgi:hypothetical protein
VSVTWFGELRTVGTLDASVALRVPAGKVSRLRLTVGGQSHEATVHGAGEEALTASFGTYKVSKPGYQKFTLRSLGAAGEPIGDVEALVLDGPASVNAHFNLQRRRNAASVHLAYVPPKGAAIEAFYCEMTALDDPLWTYYMACGWRRGYFGMQVNSPTERRIIFSVWDAGNEPTSRDKVAEADQVKLVGKGDGVVTGSFGNEGTGGHSHLVFNWKTGTKQRFLVTAKATDATHTIYAGYYFHPDQRKWMLISSWLTPKDGGLLRGIHSFLENFGGDNGHLRRKALFGNQWIRTSDGKWLEITEATFSHDDTGRADRLDRFMGVENGQFFLSNGGFIAGSTKFGESFTRPAKGKAPTDIVLPVLP